MNPYEAPQVVASTLPQAEAVPEASPLVPQRPERWGPVFVFNLPAMLVLGVYVNQMASFMAMVAACIVLFLVSLTFVRQSAQVARRLIAGGKVVAISQILPLVHIGIGKMAYEFLWEADLRGALNWSIRVSFYFTLLVGAGLIAVAYVVGIFLEKPQSSSAQDSESLAVSRDSDSSQSRPKRS